MTSVEGVPLDFALSPYTGWTRAHWERVLARLTYGYVLAAEQQGSYARALYPDDRRDLPDAVDALEAFARIASAWGAWLSNPRNPAELEFGGRVLNVREILAQALLDGTNRNNPRTYWGDMGDMDQRIVEAADIAVTLWLTRERVFERMDERERAQLIGWLAQVDDKEVYNDNWILFPVLPMTLRLKLSYPVNVQAIDARLDQAAAFYRGDGWYADGMGAEFELYNAWMFGYHYLLWAWMDGARRPEYCERVLQRARSFLGGFQHFFGANGAYPAWGRSMVYRFAAVSCFAVGHLLRIAPLSAGALRRVSSGCIKYFYERECIDPQAHFLRQGFHGDFPAAGEAYISPGSPSWACHGLFALAFSADDPFWTETEAPLPVERGDFDLALAAPGLVVAGRRNTGQVFLLNGGSGHQPENPRHNYVSKYGKLVYSTHFPFNVLPAGKSYAPDAMVALAAENLFSHRFTNLAYGVAPGVIWSEFAEYVEGEPQLVRVAVLLWHDLQLRLTFVQTTRRVRAVEAPGALGAHGAADVIRRSDTEMGWEYAEADGRALAIKRLLGYDAQRTSEPFLGYSNINLAYAYAEQPLVEERSTHLGARVLASASLLRPAPFDPAREFDGLEVTAEADGSFRVRFADGESAFVSLANELPTHARVGGLDARGERMRALRVNDATSRFTAIGVSQIERLCRLDSDGAFRLEREGDRVHLATNTGIQFERDWLARPIRQIDARSLSNEWVEVTAQGSADGIPSTLVREWQRQNERTFVEFRLSL